MGQELATTTGNSVTAWSEPQLPSSLRAELDSTTSYALAAIIGPEDYALVKAELERCQIDRTPCAPEKIADMLASTAVMHPDAKMNDMEQQARLRGYIKALKDLPEEPLRLAFLDCAQTVMFFPKAAEIRTRAVAILNNRIQTRHRLTTLALKHEREYVAPKPDVPLTAEERDEFNLAMRRCRLKTRAFPDGDIRRLEPGETDPAPDPDEPHGGVGEEPGLPGL